MKNMRLMQCKLAKVQFILSKIFYATFLYYYWNKAMKLKKRTSFQWIVRVGVRMKKDDDRCQVEINGIEFIFKSLFAMEKLHSHKIVCMNHYNYRLLSILLSKLQFRLDYTVFIYIRFFKIFTKFGLITFIFQTLRQRIKMNQFLLFPIG